jgi:hypothetical protein
MGMRAQDKRDCTRFTPALATHQNPEQDGFYPGIPAASITQRFDNKNVL